MSPRFSGSVRLRAPACPRPFLWVPAASLLLTVGRIGLGSGAPWRSLPRPARRSRQGLGRAIRPAAAAAAEQGRQRPNEQRHGRAAGKRGASLRFPCRDLPAHQRPLEQAVAGGGKGQRDQDRAIRTVANDASAPPKLSLYPYRHLPDRDRRRPAEARPDSGWRGAGAVHRRWGCRRRPGRPAGRRPALKQMDAEEIGVGEVRHGEGDRLKGEDGHKYSASAPTPAPAEDVPPQCAEVVVALLAAPIDDGKRHCQRQSQAQPIQSGRRSCRRTRSLRAGPAEQGQGQGRSLPAGRSGPALARIHVRMLSLRTEGRRRGEQRQDA